MPGRYGRARVRHVGRRAHLRYRIRLNRPGPHPRYVRRIARPDDGIRARPDDNEQVADEETSGRPGSARGLADFFRQSEERPVASRAARAADAAIAAVATIAALITATTAAIVATTAMAASAARAAPVTVGRSSGCQRKAASRRTGPGRRPLLASCATYPLSSGPAGTPSSAGAIRRTYSG